MAAARKNISGLRIKMARVGKNMKQIELSVALDVEHDIELSLISLSRIERGIRHVTDIELLAFADVLDVSTEWLLHGDKNK